MLTGLRVFQGAILFGATAFVAAECAAQSTTPDASPPQSCLQIPRLAPDGRLLTREENIARHDQALLESLNNAEACRNTANAAATAGESAGGGGGGGSGEAAGLETAVESVPVSDVQGDIPASALPRESAENKREDETTAAIQPDRRRNSTNASGKLPEDIPPAANDDIIAKQFREAAMAATDPVVKQELWDEYRRYKNLPVQEVPENGTEL